MRNDVKKAGKSASEQLVAFLVILIGLLLAARFLPVQQWLRSFNDWVGKMGLAGIFIFIAVYAAATVLLAPGAILTIGAGFAFGLWKGFLAVSAGSTLGAALAFLVARFIARDRVEAIAKGNEKFRNIDNDIGQQGAKLVFLLRLSPVIPLNRSNYIYGLTGVTFWPYVLASLLGMTPGPPLYVYIGTAGKAAVSRSPGEQVIERDYGCGDPSRSLREGETVLDLGSGTGKVCFIAAQIVGPKGKVIGVDMTDEMLEVARRNAPIVAERIGYANVEFCKGRIQDLALDLELLDRELKQNPIMNAASFLAADALAEELRVKHPLIASDSIDVVVSNCVLNLVEPKSKRQLFDEICRVLEKAGAP